MMNPMEIENNLADKSNELFNLIDDEKSCDEDATSTTSDLKVYYDLNSVRSSIPPEFYDLNIVRRSSVLSPQFNNYMESNSPLSVETGNYNGMQLQSHLSNVIMRNNIQQLHEPVLMIQPNGMNDNNLQYSKEKEYVNYRQYMNQKNVADLMNMNYTKTTNNYCGISPSPSTSSSSSSYVALKREYRPTAQTSGTGIINDTATNSQKKIDAATNQNSKTISTSVDTLIEFFNYIYSGLKTIANDRKIIKELLISNETVIIAAYDIPNTKHIIKHINYTKNRLQEEYDLIIELFTFMKIYDIDLRAMKSFDNLLKCFKTEIEKFSKFTYFSMSASDDLLNILKSLYELIRYVSLNYMLLKHQVKNKLSNKRQILRTFGQN